MANELVRLQKGLESNIPQTITPGTIWFAEDAGKLFIDTTINSQNVRVPIRSAAGSNGIKYYAYPSLTQDTLDNYPVYEVEIVDPHNFTTIDSGVVLEDGDFINILAVEGLPPCYFRFTGENSSDVYYDAIFTDTYATGTSLLSSIVIFDEAEIVDDKTIRGLIWSAASIPANFVTGEVNQATGLTTTIGTNGLVPEYPINSPTNLVLTGRGWAAASSVAWQSF